MSLSIDIAQLNEKIQHESIVVVNLLNEISKVIVGQQQMTERLLIGLLSNGHILLEGVPGLAKTLAIKTLQTPQTFQTPQTPFPTFAQNLPHIMNNRTAVISGATKAVKNFLMRTYGK